VADSLIGLELETGGVLIKFVRTAAESGGALHVQEARYPAHSPPAPVHRHPKQDERFVIVEGSLLFRIAGKDTLVRAGNALEIPRGTFHRAYNSEDVPTLVIWETRPALRTGEFFAAMGRASRGRARPRLIDAAAILNEYRDEFELPKSPRLVQRIVFRCLAPFGRRVLSSR
jgi:mannose-6-phosphate isomerase-like protein (cupin superfamily)